MSLFEVSSGSGWQEKTFQRPLADYRLRARVGSQRERRRLPKQQWLRSRLPFFEYPSALTLARSLEKLA